MTSWPPVETTPPERHPDAPAAGTELPEHYEHCFGCGSAVEHGLRLRATAADGLTVRSEFTVTTAHQGAPGLAHGGLLACAFDEALGGAVGHLLRRPAVTGKLETDFLRPVPVGATLVIDAHIDGLAGRKIYVSADGTLGGKLAVRARAVFISVELRHFVEHGRPEELAKLGLRPRGARTVEVNP